MEIFQALEDSNILLKGITKAIVRKGKDFQDDYQVFQGYFVKKMSTGKGTLTSG